MPISSTSTTCPRWWPRGERARERAAEEGPRAGRAPRPTDSSIPTDSSTCNDHLRTLSGTSRGDPARRDPALPQAHGASTSAQLKALDAMTKALVKKLLHGPMRALRDGRQGRRFTEKLDDRCSRSLEGLLMTANPTAPGHPRQPARRLTQSGQSWQMRSPRRPGSPLSS